MTTTHDHRAVTEADSDQTAGRPGRGAARVALLAAVAVLAVWIVAAGGGTDIAARAADWQREAQAILAGELRALKGGETGALLRLMGLCFAYGVLHAVGPGHGKLVIGGYGLTRPATAWRLAGIALTASLGQAVTAVAVIGAGVAVLGWGRERIEGVEAIFAPLSAIAIGLVGCWLLLRGLRRAARQRAAARPAGVGAAHDHAHTRGEIARHDAPGHGHSGGDAHAHAHAHSHGPGHGCHGHAGSHGHAHHHDDHCGHRHGPTLEEAESATSLREALALAAAIALRPCTGALFLLLITARMEVFPAGVAGAFAMGLGTGAVTAAVALLAVVSRRAALGLAEGTAARLAARAAAPTEALAGLVIIALAALLLNGGA